MEVTFMHTRQLLQKKKTECARGIGGVGAFMNDLLKVNKPNKKGIH
jgi:hypothetical protein